MYQRGQLVGNDYLLQKILSQGPCGVVWRALDQKRGQVVDVHFTPEVLRTNAEAMDRFRRQFAAVQTFRHQHVVTPERLVEDQWGGVFWVVRLVDGPSLDECIRQRTQVEGQFPSRSVFDVLRPIASVLDEAQQHKLVHRSLSPGVIVLHPAEGVQIFDFELTGVVRESLDPTLLAEEERHSRFLAPEQLDGRGASPYSDQYSLGVIAYELFGGQYQGPDAAWLPLLDQAEYVNSALQRAIHRDPAARFPSCREFIDALEDVKPPPVVPPPLPELPKPPPLETLTSFEIIASAASEAKATSVTKKIHQERRFQRLFHLWNITLLIGIIIFVVCNWKGLSRRITGQLPSQGTSDSVPEKNRSPRTLSKRPNVNDYEQTQPDDVVRFAGTRGTGKRIVFVVDVSAAMGHGEQTPLSHAKEILKRSLHDMNNSQQFQVIYFNEKPNPLGTDDGGPMIPFSSSKREQVKQHLEKLSGSGDGKPFDALIAAIAMKPDLIFFLSCENAEQLNAVQIRQIGQASGDIPIHCVEIGNGGNSDTPTPIEKLAVACQGEFYLVSDGLSRAGQR